MELLVSFAESIFIFSWLKAQAHDIVASRKRKKIDSHLSWEFYFCLRTLQCSDARSEVKFISLFQNNDLRKFLAHAFGNLFTLLWHVSDVRKNKRSINFMVSRGKQIKLQFRTLTLILKKKSFKCSTEDFFSRRYMC